MTVNSRLGLARASVLLFIVLGAGTIASAQQPNSTAATFLVDGHDSGAYPIRVVTQVPQSVQFSASGPIGEPFLVFAGLPAPVGTSFGTAGLFDLQMGLGLALLVNGFQPVTPADALAFIPPSGSFVQNVGVTTPGIDLGLQAVVGDPTHPLGATISAATFWRTTADQVDELVFAHSDDSVYVPFAGGQRNLINGTFPGFFVNANGNVTLGMADGAPNGTAQTLASGPPRVALAWRDLDPSLQGQVTVVQSSSGAVSVEYYGVAIVDPSGGVTAESFNGLLTIDPAGAFSWRVDSTMPGPQITGVSPGGQLVAGSPINLSVATPTANAPLGDLFEIYTDRKPFDLLGVPFTWNPVDSNGWTSLTAPPPPLVITRVVPNVGPQIGLASLHLRGTGFDAGTQVLVGGVPAYTVDVTSGDELVIRTPPGALGPADVQVIDSQGRTFTVPQAYTYIVNQPVALAGPMSPGMSVEIPFTTGFVFPFYDEWYESVWLNANGAISFDAGDSTIGTSLSSMTSGAPKVAQAYADWVWGPTSLVAYHCTPFFCTIAFIDVVPPLGGAPVTVVTKLSHHGEIFFDYVTTPVVAVEFIAGVSAGSSAVPGPAQDLSTFVGPSLPHAGVFEVFDAANPFDLGGNFLDVIPAQVVSPWFILALHP